MATGLLFKISEAIVTQPYSLQIPSPRVLSLLYGRGQLRMLSAAATLHYYHLTKVFTGMLPKEQFCRDLVRICYDGFVK